MGSLFRSEEMAKCQLFLQKEAAYSCISELGEVGLVQFIDLNPKANAFQRTFVSEVRRCDEMERKLCYLEKEIRKDGIHMKEVKANTLAPDSKETTELEAIFEKLENEVREINQNAEAMKKNYLELVELQHILRKTQIFFDEREGSLTEMTSSKRALVAEDSYTRRARTPLGFVTGVILRERIHPFERMLWRACRGNAFLRQAEFESPIEDPVTGNEVYKSVFVVFFQGEQLKARVKKICEGFHATLYPCPEPHNERREMAMGVKTNLEDLSKVLAQTQDHRHRVLVATAKHIKTWLVQVRKSKAIYFTLNLFSVDLTRRCIIGECWVPKNDMENIKLALRRGIKQSGSSLPPVINAIDTSEEPPTYFRTNKFTNAFQVLINSYGIATYREVNPAPYTIITFPFLFAVMFGDVGHGMIMSLFSGWMVFCEASLAAKKTTNEIWNIFFGGRYVIFLMGLFSIYTGTIYNDIFSKSVNVLGSHWTVGIPIDEIMHEKHMELDPARDYGDSPYPVGLDPVWAIAENKIRFLNAYKMKISIIIGVIHMLFGVSLGVFNYVHFKDKISLFTMFLPQMIFLLFLFFYMVFLMFIKWVLYGPKNPAETGPFCAPSILITFINMVLFKDTPVVEPCSPWMYPHQKHIQYFLVLTALVCVPWMLVTRPYFIMRQRKKDKKRHSQESQKSVHEKDSSLPNLNGYEGGDEYRDHEEVGPPPARPQGSEGRGGHEEEPMSEIWIHQGIHTIEYVLGSISHTASYLRLWALSLAHAQLSEVLWNMVVRPGLSASAGLFPFGGLVMFFVFAFWAALTISILVLMEGLSAFLHTLRLHWVEFQSKFYGGAGYLFMPFSFKTITAEPST